MPDNELQTLFLFILMIALLWTVSRRMNAVVLTLFDQVAIFSFDGFVPVHRILLASLTA